jgi:phosphoribosyl 1,2-cyclic phosphodiesterase
MTQAPSGPSQITFWGTRGSISTPGRATEKFGGNTPCITLEYGNTYIIVDAGTGIRNVGLELVERLKDVKSLELHLLLSHTHWDHIQGLPFFLPAYQPGVKLRIYGNARKGGFLESILRGQMDEEYFPVSMSALAAEVAVEEVAAPRFQVGEVAVDWEEQIFHPGGCARYRFTVGGKRIVYASDVELDKVAGPEHQDAESRARLQEYLDFIAGADLLIGDGQYTPEEYRQRANFGHTTIPLLVELARRAKVRQLAIFHHDPQHSDTFLDEYLQQLTAACPQTPEFSFFFAREGLTLPI